MDIRDIIDIIGTNRNFDEQVSLPFTINENGNEKIGFFTFDSIDNSESTMVIIKMKRKFIFDPSTSELETIEINQLCDKTITFDQAYDLEELDSLYETYYDRLDSYMKGEMDKDEMIESFRKLVSDSYMEVYDEMGMNLKEETHESNTIEDDQKKGLGGLR